MVRIEIKEETTDGMADWNNLWINFTSYLRSQSNLLEPGIIKDTLRDEWGAILHRQPLYLTFESDKDAAYFLLRFS
jgi:hypothetical protein